MLSSDSTNMKDENESLSKAMDYCQSLPSSALTNTNVRSDLRGLRPKLSSQLEIKSMFEKLCTVAESTVLMMLKTDGASAMPSMENKFDILLHFLMSQPHIFISRFGHHLSWQQLDYIESLNLGDERLISDAVHQVQSARTKVNQHISVRNRRYQAMLKLLDAGVYFSEEEMKHRHPALYHQMVGRHLTAEEARVRASEKTESSFSMLLQSLAGNRDEQMRSQQEENEEIEEEEESDSEESETEEVLQNDKQKSQLREEFLRIMKEKFLAGEDKDFDYQSVDDDPSYDDVKLIERDEQDKYFDASSEEETPVNSQYTGIQDY